MRRNTCSPMQNRLSKSIIPRKTGIPEHTKEAADAGSLLLYCEIITVFWIISEENWYKSITYLDTEKQKCYFECKANVCNADFMCIFTQTKQELCKTVI